MTHFACDLCGENAPIEIEVCRQYTGGQPIHVCSNCGLVYVTERRSSEEVAQSWSEIYADKRYDPAWPAVEARLTYVAEFMAQRMELFGKRIIDIGCGDGRLLNKTIKYGTSARLGLEPTVETDWAVRGQSKILRLSAEAAAAKVDSGRISPADIVLLTWTLENCAEPRKVLEAAYKLTKPGGHIVVATGSRIGVPFKKRLSQYLSTNAADTHPTRWSAQTLAAMLSATGFSPVTCNAYEDSDWLVLIGERFEGPRQEFVRNAGGDDPADVQRHFLNWHLMWP